MEVEAVQQLTVAEEAAEQVMTPLEAVRQLAALRENLRALRRCQAAHQLCALVQGAPFIVHAGGRAAPTAMVIWYR